MNQELDIYCPVCFNHKIIENKFYYQCFGYNYDCYFRVNNRLSNKKLSKDHIKEILTLGKTRKRIKGFTSKNGKEFEAKIYLDIESDKKFTGLKYMF